ncbi:SAM-dependent methyltransferase [Longibacter salinarum]|uniref:SAM-dependent methyltransferase n=1 Tax=Longibacter salinarum TaxID=1850348 RepID=A0A2A8CYJ6_9BACT|nr:methyltransferase domain-containing protein [Longibacter salinarum]PEN13792.1 SAM-dependent methyltransferase [Longibacter salinarum]
MRRIERGQAQLFISLLCLLLAWSGCRVSTDNEQWRQPDSLSAQSNGVYTRTAPSRDGIGKVYMGREISQVMGHRGADWLERGDRESEEQPGLVVDSLDLDQDDVVADIGAGTGYFTFRIAPRVPEGRVFAVDIQPEMLDVMRARIKRDAISNVTLVRGTERNPKLPADSIDVVLMVDAYHEFAYPWEMMQSLRKSLVPGGRVVLVEYRQEDPSVPIKQLHTMTEAQVKREMEAVGFEWEKTLDMLPQQHFIVVKNPTRKHTP